MRPPRFFMRLCRKVITSRWRRFSRIYRQKLDGWILLGTLCLAISAYVLLRRVKTVPPLDEEQLFELPSVKQYDQSRLLIPVRGEAILSYKFASNIIVSEKNKLVFCPIPKAANSNWKYLIRKFEGIPDYADLTTAHNPNMSGLRYLSDYSASEAQEILCSPTFFKFVFVRNPYMRLLSCYMDKFRNTDPKYVYSEYRSFLAQLFNWRYARTVNLSVDPRPTFNAFIDELTKHEPADMNAHWMPQTIHCGIGVTPYDFIGHMEHVDVDAKRVLQKLGKQHEHFPSQQEIGFPSSGASNFVADKLYTKQLKVKVRALYDADFHILGYD